MRQVSISYQPVVKRQSCRHSLTLAHTGFWLSSFAGACIAGGSYGMLGGIDEAVSDNNIPVLEMMVTGSLLGALLTVTVALPVYATVIAFAWNFPRPAVAGLSGFLTLLLAGFVAFGNVGDAISSGLVGFFFAAAFSIGFFHLTQLGRQVQQRPRHRQWQFSLKFVFIQTTLISFVILMWMAIYKMFFVW